MKFSGYSVSNAFCAGLTLSTSIMAFSNGNYGGALFNAFVFALNGMAFVWSVKRA